MTGVVLAAVNNGLVKGLEAEGVVVRSLTSVEDLDRFVSGELFFAVVDETLPFALDMVVRIKSRVDGPDRDRLPVLGVGDGGHVIRCLADAQLGSANASKIIECARQIRYRRARQRRLFDQEVVLEVPTTPEQVEKAGDVLELLVGGVGYTEEDEVKLGNSLREAIGNAAEHGNKNDPQRKIHINFLRTSDRVTVVITDEGSGFDTTSFLARADQVSALEHTRSRRENEARPGGLGVFIMKETCDEIRFNDEGNSIYLMKFLPNHIS